MGISVSLLSSFIKRKVIWAQADYLALLPLGPVVKCDAKQAKPEARGGSVVPRPPSTPQSSKLPTKLHSACFSAFSA